MKILFGIQGTGNGHISRARTLAKYLNQHAVEVTYLLSGRDKDKLFDMEVFGNYLHRRGLTFATNNGRIDYWKTLRNNQLLTFFNDIKSLDVTPYDLIITDFEPVTAWAAKLANKPLLGIGHQYAFGKNTPLAGESAVAKWIMKNFAPAQNAIGLHWHPYNDNVLPPIIDTELTSTETANHILVYLPFENQAQIANLLNQVSDRVFILYSPELTHGQQGNVSLRPTSYQSFKRDLASAQGVICNSGFELISECLHIGIPILTKPLHGQMEQHSNALALQQLGYATVVEQLSVDAINRWLAQTTPIIAKPLPDVAKHLSNWIIGGQWHNYQAMSEALWSSE